VGDMGPKRTSTRSSKRKSANIVEVPKEENEEADDVEKKVEDNSTGDVNDDLTPKEEESVKEGQSGLATC